MDHRPIDPERYGKLLAEVQPGVIDTAEEHERLLTIAEQLMDKGEGLYPEEQKLLRLLVFLIEVFESEIEQAEDDGEEPHTGETPLPRPYETLRRLLDSRGWDESNLLDIFGNPRLVAEVMSGRREISRGQAKTLGRLFEVPPKLFFEREG
jgi:HTH-type transcriptional regulator/antitoxin HigA